VSVSSASEYLALNLALRRPSLAQLIRALHSRKRRQANRRRGRKDIGPNTGDGR